MKVNRYGYRYSNIMYTVYVVRSKLRKCTNFGDTKWQMERYLSGQMFLKGEAKPCKKLKRKEATNFFRLFRETKRKGSETDTVSVHFSL